MVSFSLFEQDAIKEIFNMGIGRAADSLSRMIQEEVLLSVPHIEMVDRQQAIHIIQGRSASHVAAIRQNFRGTFNGVSMLIYPESNSLELVRTLLGEDMPLESLTELEQESLLEVGNVILNACLGTFANMFATELDFDLPEYVKGSCQDLLSLPAVNGSMVPPLQQLVFLIVDFITGAHTPQRNTIKGFVILLLDMSTIAHLQDELGKLGG
ncbi:MAG: chemotaxis protein CheX [Magnetococcales bacterium]|nr:chemotaxis protein CheC [Magnetococcales bacterium]NGZ29103.1 chemotaxis protein CheX [Magnetococcales bacterium]